MLFTILRNTEQRIEELHHTDMTVQSESRGIYWQKGRQTHV